MGWRRCRVRLNLARAICDAGFSTKEEFGRAIGFTGRAVGGWLRCKAGPSRDARAAIARVLEVSPGADCDEVVESDLEWLLEPCDVLRR